jgi:LmbE family N-acetylglucosaminyl deacetylase
MRRMVTKLVVVAHSDDETAGASKLLADHAGELRVLHATDSAPINPDYARRAGYESRDEYRAARRSELRAAMALAKIGASQCVETKLPIADLDAGRNIRAIASEIAAVLDRHREVDSLYTHAYEGGHPDHDAVALAARLGVDNSHRSVALFEFPEYHAAGGSLTLGTLIPGPDVEGTQFTLTPAEQRRKKKMLACFVSQRRILGNFPVETEWLRPAPRYDFSAPPHPCTLYYETRPMGWTGEGWRQLAREALSQ